MSNEFDTKKVTIPPECQIRETPEQLFKRVEESFALMYDGQHFLLTDLFPNAIWARYPKDIRLNFSMLFRAKAKELGVDESNIRLSKQIVYIYRKPN